MLRSLLNRARRAAGSVLPTSPNNRSKTMRGLFSIGSGTVGLCQEMVLLIAQGLASHDPASSRPSSESSSDASCVCRANSFATI